MTFKDFLSHCTACGGDWTSMLFTGIKEVAPSIYEAMPDRSYEFDELAFIVNHLCEDRPHLRYNICRGNIIEFGIDGKFHFRPATEEEMDMPLKEFEMKYNGIPEDYFKSKGQAPADQGTSGIRPMKL